MGGRNGGTYRRRRCMTHRRCACSTAEARNGIRSFVLRSTRQISRRGMEVRTSRIRATAYGGHGTEMSGIALYGDLVAFLAGNGPVQLTHRLESVKILPGSRRERPRPVWPYHSDSYRPRRSQRARASARHLPCDDKWGRSLAGTTLVLVRFARQPRLRKRDRPTPYCRLRGQYP